ncbi:MAG: alpha/beta hydrolase [Hydrococcus sp. RU_2_2]|jgi:alpha-beta hydrolase superfamily lysophospholipase|nr:alpha/beta hydrolase [Hydrococcus sp. RU_2_2]
MEHLEGTFQGAGELNLYYQSWTFQKPAKAIVAIVHGLGAHGGLFFNAVEYLVDRGYGVYAFDLRGHGRSPGQRGHINNWGEFREDLNLFLQFIREREPDSPLFLWGHSLGGAIALDYALRFPEGLQGIMVTSPAIGKVGVSPFKIATGKLLSRVWPRFSLKLGLDRYASSRDLSAISIFLQDPLRHEYASARLATEFLQTVDWIQSHVSDLQLPLLILHGSADRVTHPDSSWAFCLQVTFPDKECYELPGSYHDLHADVNRDEILADLGEWLERHLPGATIYEPLALCASKLPTNRVVGHYREEEKEKTKQQKRKRFLLPSFLLLRRL